MTAADTCSSASHKPLILIGAGGHARVLLDLLACLGREVLFITDRNVECHGTKVGEVEVRGPDELIFEHQPDEVRLVNAIGSTALPLVRRDVYERFVARGYTFDTLVHPSAQVARTARIEAGAQVMAGAVIQAGVSIGQNALINTQASIDHDSVIGSHVHIAPGVTLSGDVRIGDTSHLGTGATVIQSIRIGRDTIVGAGAVVLRDVGDGQRVAGVPARPLPDRLAASASRREPFAVMLSAAGRRVALLKLVRQSIHESGMEPRVIATDITRNSAAFHHGDISRLVPRYEDPQCLPRLLELCQELNIRLILPTIDPDLPFYARNRAAFEQIGTYVMVSSSQTVRICNDKRFTHDWLVEQGFPTVRQIDAAALLEGDNSWHYPLFIKPRGGSSSIGAGVVQDVHELRLLTRDDEYIVQELAPGREYTVDVYLDRRGKCRCAVPRLRLETRGGEVSKGMTVRHEQIESLACRVAEALPGAVGIMNIQIFYDAATGRMNVSEVNPRLGGGYPLSHQAGAPMVRWVIEELVGRPLTMDRSAWTDGLVMLRFDEAVFVDRSEAGIERQTLQAAAVPPAVA